MGFWSDLLDTAKDVAPTVAATAATIATGNPMAGAAVSALARKLAGRGADVDIEDIAADILGDPALIQQFRMGMRQLELDELRMRTLDVQDARKTVSISRGAIIISTIVVLAYFIVTLFVLTVEVPDGSQNLTYLLLGNLGTGFGMVLTFWLGSSTGSKEKDAVTAAYAEAARLDAQARGTHVRSG